MAFARATFSRFSSDLSGPAESMVVQYNPAEFSLSKSVQYAEIGIPGLDMPIQQFVRGQTEMLSLELFFDTTEHGMDEESAVAVTNLTDRFYHLVRVDHKTKAPPICLFSWGDEGFPGSNLVRGNTLLRRNGFLCLVESIDQKFTLFSPHGVPLRATMSVKLREYQTLTEIVASTEEAVTLTTAEGTLDELASREYNDPSKWREIAEANDIDDPLALAPGTPITLPA